LNRTIAARWRAWFAQPLQRDWAFACPAPWHARAVDGRPAPVALPPKTKFATDYDRCFPPAKRLMALQRGSKILRRIAGAEDTNDARSVRGNETMLTIVRCASALAMAVGLIFALETVPAARFDHDYFSK
jgi:hypothetical protein